MLPSPNICVCAFMYIYIFVITILLRWFCPFPLCRCRLSLSPQDFFYSLLIVKSVALSSYLFCIIICKYGETKSKPVYSLNKYPLLKTSSQLKTIYFKYSQSFWDEHSYGQAYFQCCREYGSYLVQGQLLVPFFGVD